MESYSYEIIQSDPEPTIKLSNSSVWKFEINPKYGCAKKKKYAYDRDCTKQDQRKAFRLLRFDLKDNCTIPDAYFSFENSEIEKLGKIRKNL